MSDIIQLLPDSVANQIAAGEVIQRPASVIKELVENAVDAGARNISVVVTDAGRTNIQVIDDGKGMSETDARLSFERHATSKIRQAQDLFALHTMGFRGEALASIAAVAQVELKTRRPEDEIGTHLCISGSRFQSQEPCSCPVGSNFQVENLFFNVPARRKFLKSNTTELNNIIQAYERIVLVYPEISFRLFSNQTEVFNLPATHLRQRIVDVFGKKMNQDILPVSVETTMCKITGFVGKPQAARKKGVKQYFFANGRYMKHPYFHKAVMNAYERLVPEGDQIPYFIYFEVPAEDIDVNIHPVKTEIKFENEQAIWQILSAAVKDSVGMFNDVPTIDFDTQGKPDIPVYNPDNDTQGAPAVPTDPLYNPFKPGAARSGRQPWEDSAASMGEGPSAGGGRQQFGGYKPKDSVPDQWEELYKGLNSEDPQTDLSWMNDDGMDGIHVSRQLQGQDAGLFESRTMQGDIIEEKSPTHYQYKGKYIMTAVKSGLMIIDQHRAHVRILYERYLKELAERKVHSEQTLFPEMVQFSAAGQTMLAKILPELKEMGFELTDMGGGSYSINATPSGLDGISMPQLLESMVAAAIEKASSVKDEIDRSLALSMAQAAAIPHGQVLSNDEMETVVDQLFACSNPNLTPSGKNILCILQQSQIEQLLG